MPDLRGKHLFVLVLFVLVLFQVASRFRLSTLYLFVLKISPNSPPTRLYLFIIHPVNSGLLFLVFQANYCFLFRLSISSILLWRHRELRRFFGCVEVLVIQLCSLIHAHHGAFQGSSKCLLTSR
ncbi:hypothetical protein V8F06_007856 [Rhypophila decipiens]